MITPRPSSPLSRRAVLRGVGGAIALPWLEAMTRDRLTLAGGRAFAGTAAAAEKPLRFAFVFIPNGVDPAAWMPSQVGDAYVMPPSLEPLAAVRSRFSVVGGLAHRNAQALGDGPGDHARSAACFLTGVHPVKTAGSDIQGGVSIDQVLARRFGDRTALPSIELGCEPALQSGNCDSGYSCAYSANISWQAPSRPMLKEISPRAVFERLFSVGGSSTAGDTAEQRARRLRSRRSILDFAGGDAARLGARLGVGDRRRVDEYLDGVRALERRVESIERDADDPRSAALNTPPGAPDDYREHVRLMNDLLVLAFRTDRTRVATFMLANEGSNRPFPFLGVPEGHHHLSHHGGDESMVEKIRRINRFQAELFADLLSKLDTSPEGDETLLDRSMVVFGSAIADGNRHNHDDLPVIVAGRAGGALSPGRSMRAAAGTPMCNLFVTMLRAAGAHDAAHAGFGDSTGELTGM